MKKYVARYMCTYLSMIVLLCDDGIVSGKGYGWEEMDSSISSPSLYMHLDESKYFPERVPPPNLW